MTKETVQNYWEQFLASLPPDSPYRTKTYVAEGWGDGPAMADELGALIAQGTKTATCSALWEWEAEGNPIPAARFDHHRPGWPRRAALHRRDGGSDPFASTMKWMPISPVRRAKAICL